MFVNSHRRFVVSLTYGSVLRRVKCTAPSSGAVAPTEMKARSFFFFLACTGSFVLRGLLSI